MAPAATMGVVRVKQNVFRESSVGMIATVGDPTGLTGSWLTGADFTYQTSRFSGNKNFLVGVWGLVMERSDLRGDKTATGFKVGYPNDLWNVSFSARRVGDGYQPSLGFVPRPGVYSYDLEGEFDPRAPFLEHPPDVQRVPGVGRHGPARAMGKLQRVHGTSELALRER